MKEEVEKTTEKEDILWEYCETANRYIMNRLKNSPTILRWISVGVITVLAITALSCDGDIKGSEKRVERLMLIRLRTGVPEEKRKELLRRLTALNTSLRSVSRYLKAEYGFQNSKEGLDSGFEIGVRISFASVHDRDYFDGKTSLTGTFDPMYGELLQFMTPLLAPDCGFFNFDFIPEGKAFKTELTKGERLDHLVFFRFRKNITDLEKQEVIRRFLELKNSLKEGKPYIRFIEYGYENDKSAVDMGFDIVFRVGFSSEADRDYYVGKPFLTDSGKFDPMHDAFKNFVSSYLDHSGGALVFDYQVVNPL
ncbi:Dabb family protein [Chryseobacterium rhizoplanae]|uniref:Dabb family protein n=1 Tax=Chryseobacterium rhizoplanae TaxID=1609531 RepID=UPI001CE24B96|nr:Dabb family protein [Chryseobacterium rhizoplanae]UCA61805.1 Dabb family protein [Chryseobacterium rhizoplanae]